jgi:hypothetical protein
VSNFLLIIVGLVVVGAVLYFQYQAHQKKVAEFTVFAAERGWSYVERDDDLVDRFLGAPFGRGHGQVVKHVLRGAHRGREVLVFEYSYKEADRSGSSRGTELYHHTVASVSTPTATPTLEVGREGLGRKLLGLVGLVGLRDLQLESEEFNAAFHVQTDDDRFAYDVLHPRMMEWLVADGQALETPFRFERGDLLTWDRDEIDLQKIDGMVAYLCDVLDRVPSFVWNR